MTIQTNPTNPMTRRLHTRLSIQRQAILRLPLVTRWLLFLAAWSTLTFGGLVLIAFFLVPAPPVMAAQAGPPLMAAR